MSVQLMHEQVTQADLDKWHELNEQLKKIKGEEITLRLKIFKGMFHNPVEGTNSIPLAEGWVLKGKHTINRSIDIGALSALREEFTKAGIHTDEVVKYKPELKIAAYRTLTEEQRHLFDQALVVKDGSPALEIVLPKRRTS